jgi:hypothetical protein
MVPVIAGNGASFNGAFRYYCHDKQGSTRERVEWTQTVNMLTECVAKAWKVMAYTAKNQDRLKEASGQTATGRKLQKPVFAFSLSWAPDQRPDRPTMLEAAKRSLEALGLAEHQAIIVAHNDRPHRHVHIVANTVHPLTGLVAQLRHTKRKLSEFALHYEREGGKIYCARREENHEKRQRGEQTRYDAPDIAEAWRTTTNGRDFKAALEATGYVLAQGRKRLVIVDPYGKTHNPARLLKNVRAADIRTRLMDVDLTRLPDADAVVSDMRRTTEPETTQPIETRQPDAGDELRADENREAPTSPDGEAPSAPDDANENQSAFEELAARQTADLCERQKDERRREIERLRERLAATKKRLIAYHGLPERRASLVALRDRIETAPWWKRLFGLTKHDRQRMAEEIYAYRDAVGQCRESLAHARTQARAAVADLTARHGNERRRLETHIDRLRERNEAFRGVDARAPSREREVGMERRRESPSLER